MSTSKPYKDFTYETLNELKATTILPTSGLPVVALANDLVIITHRVIEDQSGHPLALGRENRRVGAGADAQDRDTIIINAVALADGLFPVLDAPHEHIVIERFPAFINHDDRRTSVEPLFDAEGERVRR